MTSFRNLKLAGGGGGQTLPDPAQFVSDEFSFSGDGGVIKLQLELMKKNFCLVISFPNLGGDEERRNG
ncbi:hypothetical protein RchiOBHm_Chr5g0064991 [Rosa chinensis]|uniref:Uncharacterized protein n=1 Tax=Rosa chinensis TaxID=74649 RepID=A0A2P6QIT5_ROSCH|nr:hypothetical protein RchiOBHm_Chr5g0064991 [Rosa chinensis]